LYNDLSNVQYETISGPFNPEPNNNDLILYVFVYLQVSLITLPVFCFRTNTVILVDKNGNCDYTERTLHTPVDVKNLKWTTIKHQFKLNSNL
jgi:hypothetical protein